MIFEKYEGIFFNEFVNEVRKLRIKFSRAGYVLKMMNAVNRKRHKAGKSFLILSDYSIRYFIDKKAVGYIEHRYFAESPDFTEFRVTHKSRKEAKRVIDDLIMYQAKERMKRIIQSHRQQAEKLSYIKSKSNSKTTTMTPESEGEWYP